MRSIQKRILLGVLAAGVGCSGKEDTVQVSGQSASVNGITASIDWRMPERTRRDQNGFLEPLPPPRSFVHPASWTVTLDGCGATAAGSPILRWNWKVTTPNGPVLAQRFRTACSADVELPSLDTYPVELTITLDDGRSATFSRMITVRDYLIVSMGDSIASAEGNPEFDADPYPARWSDFRCHRSWYSGPAQAAIALEKADPHSSVTFISVACSGAGIETGLLRPYEGQVPEGNFKYPPQVDQVADLVRDGNKERMIDALLIQTGANDLGFSTVLRQCAHPLENPCYDSFIDTSAGPLRFAFWVAGNLTSLGYSYSHLDTALRGKLHYRKVHVAEYPDPTHNSDGSSCHIVFPDVGLGFINGDISPSESDWAYRQVVLPLRDALRRAANDYGWNYIGGITDAFSPHGYCARDTWIRGFEESLRVQRDENGTMHPNRAGHDLYRDRIFAAALQPLLFQPIHTAVWNRGGPEQVTAFDVTALDFRARDRDLRGQGWRLAWLAPYVLGGQVFYSAAWEQKDRDQVAIYDWSAADFLNKYNELEPDGWRLTSLAPYVRNGDVFYSAAWEKTGRDQLVAFDWGSASFRRVDGELRGDGWRLTALVPHALNGASLYSAVWEQTGRDQFAVYDWARADFLAKDQEARGAGWRLISAVPYVLGGQLVYSAAWEQNDADQFAVYDWARADFVAKDAEARSAGWRIKSMWSRAD